MKKLCLNMIVRNEADRIERCLTSLVNHIDRWVIADTGSTDGTDKIIEEFFKRHGVQGHLIYVPFENFSQARNAALREAQTSTYDFDYVLLADADMVLHAAPGWRDLADYPAYRLTQRAGTLAYENTRLVGKYVPARYVGATHEYLDVIAHSLPEHRVWFEDYADGSNRKDKFERDIALLKNDLKQDPDNPRSWFYLAQSYRDAGMHLDAVEAYRHRITLGGWDEELWEAQFQIGACLKAMGDTEGFVAETLRAYQRRPQRVEPLYELAKHFRCAGDNALAVLFADAGRGKPMPSDLLFLNEYAYNGGLDEEFSIAGFYLPERRREAFEVCNRLALEQVGNDRTGQLARANLLHYVQPLSAHAPSFKGHQIPFVPPAGYVPMNPSVTRRKDQMWTTVRCVNYTITPDGCYAIRGGDGSINRENPIHTRNYLLRLDSALAPELAKEIAVPSYGDYDLVKGWEDMRLYSEGDDLSVSANVREANPDGWCEQHRGWLLADTKGFSVLNTRYMRPTGDRRHEKNWMPIGTTGRFMYQIGHVVDRNGVTVAVTKPPFAAADMRGGSQLVLFRGGWLALVHEAHYGFDGKRIYTHRFVYFDADGVPLRTSLPFVFHDKQIEFAAGMCWHFDGRRLVVSYGVRDREAWIASVDAHEVAEMVGLV